MTVVVDKTRADSTRVRIAEALVGDATGCITLTARNGFHFPDVLFLTGSIEQIDVITPGSTIIARNARIDMFKGFMRLTVDKWGKIEAASQPATFEVNTQNNLSAIEYELVTIHDREG